MEDSSILWDIFVQTLEALGEWKEENGNLRIDNLEGLREQMTTGLLGPIRSRPSWKKIDGKWDSTIRLIPRDVIEKYSPLHWERRTVVVWVQ